MNCPSCGVALPEHARFCLACGARQNSEDPVPSVRREVCEIFRSDEAGSWFRAGDTYWEAIAVGPPGRYCVARSETCPRTARGRSGGVRRADEVLDELIRKLVQEGWQPLPRGPDWFSYRFERNTTGAP